jgi:hypothetical protein
MNKTSEAISWSEWMDLLSPSEEQQIAVETGFQAGLDAGELTEGMIERFKTLSDFRRSMKLFNQGL